MIVVAGPLVGLPVDLLDLGLGHEAAVGIGRDQHPDGEGREQIVGIGIAGWLRSVRRAERLEAAGRDLLERGVGILVALDQDVVVAVGDVEGNVEALGREGELLGPVHQPDVLRPVGVVALGLVGVVVQRAGGGRRVIVVVLDARVPATLLGGRRSAPLLGDEEGAARPEAAWVGVVRGIVEAAVEVEWGVRALEQIADPARLVQLLIVGLIAGQQREVHGVEGAVALRNRAGIGEFVDLADRRLHLKGREALLRAPGRGGGWISELDTGGRLLVGELEVGHLTEVRQRLAPILATGLPRGDLRILDGVPDDVGALARSELQLGVAGRRVLRRDDRLIEGGVRLGVDRQMCRDCDPRQTD